MLLRFAVLSRRLPPGSCLRCISELQRGATVGVGIISPRRCAAFLVLPRRLPPGSRLRLYFRAPERANSRRGNHGPTTYCCDVSAPGTIIQTISVLALALESVGEDSSPTLSWPQFWPRESVGEDSSPTLSWPHFLDTWLIGLIFWPRESVGEDSSPTLSWPHFLTRGSWPHFLAS